MTCKSPILENKNAFSGQNNKDTIMLLCNIVMNAGYHTPHQNYHKLAKKDAICHVPQKEVLLEEYVEVTKPIKSMH